MRAFNAALLCALFALTACKESKPDPSGLYQGSRNVIVNQTTQIAAPESAAVFAIAKVTFVNDLGYDFTPQIEHFVLQEPGGQRHAAVDTGSTALAGISNFSGVVKKDAKQDYTLAFRLSAPTAGTIFYDP